MAETGADSGGGVACGGFGEDAGIEAGDARAVNVDELFGWRAGRGAGLVGVGAGAGRWKQWAGVAGGAERWREGAGACGAAGEDG